VAKAKKQSKAEPAKVPEARSIVKQSDFPSLTLEQALRIPRALWDDFAGKSAAPHEVALSIDMTPTSGPWRSLCGAAIAYGLTEGGCNAEVITLTPLGRRIVAPEAEGDDSKARTEAALKPRIVHEFFKKYDRAKFPQDQIAENVLVTMGLPKDRAKTAVTALKATGRDVGIVREMKTGLFVALDAPTVQERAPTEEIEHEQESNVIELRREGRPAASHVVPKPTHEGSNKVFITHGQSRAIVNQIKELLNFGKFEPVVSVERESTAIPVPDKVFEDMRACSAGVIHVGSEGELLDEQGNKHIHINQNVLIEIGAAIALYQKRVILLVEKGVTLPSNLQGLYRCEYSGDKLDYDATMKLLKTFNEFRGAK